MRVRKLIVNGEPVPGVQVVKKKIGMPPFKSNLISVPGANGSLDLSTALTGGFPRYSNRAVSFDLVLVDVPGSDDLWKAMQAIGRAWHGSIIEVTTDDAEDSYFRGRATIDAFADDADGVKFTLSLDAEPYRYDFIETTSLLLAGPSALSFDVGDMPLSPEFGSITALLSIDGVTYVLAAGAQPPGPIRAKIPGLVLSPGRHSIVVITTPVVPLTMTYRSGRL